ncbi:hypothetical protein ALC57_03577, partial [Trachymyrmex cornetzi]
CKCIQIAASSLHVAARSTAHVSFRVSSTTHLRVPITQLILFWFSNCVVCDRNEQRRDRCNDEVPLNLEARQLPRGQGQSRPIDYTAIRYIATGVLVITGRVSHCIVIIFIFRLVPLTIYLFCK